MNKTWKITLQYEDGTLSNIYCENRREWRELYGYFQQRMLGNLKYDSEDAKSIKYIDLDVIEETMIYLSSGDKNEK